MNQAIRDSCKKPEEAEKGRVEIRPSIPFVSDASYSDLDKDKDKSKFIEVTCRYTPENADSKKNNYQAHVKTFDHGTPRMYYSGTPSYWRLPRKNPVSHQRPCSP